MPHGRDAVIDTHCHLDRVADLDAALANDLRAMVSVGTDAERSEATVRLAETEPRVYAAVGVHPNDAAAARDEAVRARIEALAAHPRVVAIGESGVDLHWERATLRDQLDALAWQARLAAEVGKPLVLHVRDREGSDAASREAARALRELGYGRGVLHCTNGHQELLETGLALGWFVSFAGNLTYPSAGALHEAARTLAGDRIVVETDSPYLSPVPRRGRPNVPGNVVHTAAALASLRGAEPGELERTLDANAARLYGLTPGGP